LLDQDDKLNTLVFQVDLFSARGVLPRDIQDVLARHKDIMYSSRTRYTTDVYRRIHNLKLLLAKALAKVPSDQLNDEDRRRLAELAALPEITILHIIYQQKAYEGHAKDYEFSGTSMRERRADKKIPAARSSVRNGWPCRRPVRACSSTTCTGSRKTERLSSKSNLDILRPDVFRPFSFPARQSCEERQRRSNPAAGLLRLRSR
jgi:hypothetical protein